METLILNPWNIIYDKEATRRAYVQIDKGASEVCGCEYCLNFAAARENVYPKEVRAIFHTIGVDYRKEFEVFYCNREDNGLHCYGGEFHFVGSLEYVDEAHEAAEGTPETLSFADKAESFVWAFSSRIPARDRVFADQPLVALHFAARVPWVLKTKEPK